MQPLFLYNTLTRKKEKFNPINPPFVGLYVCGPTVYNDAHIGNVRTFLSFDMINRYLLHCGYKVRYVRNITDAGHLTNEVGEGINRMESQAKLESLEPMEIVQKYTVGFHNICNLFNLKSPNIEPTATGHIIEQIEMIAALIEKGVAYEINNSVYFDVKAHNKKYNYGILSGRNIDELIAGYRDLDGQEEKRNAIDFALWKAASPSHIMQWQSPWGLGYPGWHIECSAMSTKYLGNEFDIHGGGMDLKFPHHECEIAQNLGCNEKLGARYWLHTNMLNFNGQKMSKSLGNSILPSEFISGNHSLLDKGYSPMAVKFLFLQTHYSSELDINIKGLQDAEKGIERLMNSYITLQNILPSANSTENIVNLQANCYAAMNDDFNTSILIANLFEAVRIINSAKDKKITLTQNDIDLLKKIYQNFVFDILGLKEIQTDSKSNIALEKVMKLLLELRTKAKLDKNFKLSDEIRDQLILSGIELKDSKEGTDWKI